VSVTLSVTDHLEAENLDGHPSLLVATGGTELVDARADVLSLRAQRNLSRDADFLEQVGARIRRRVEAVIGRPAAPAHVLPQCPAAKRA
jgi:hypothetical protein